MVIIGLVLLVVIAVAVGVGAGVGAKKKKDDNSGFVRGPDGGNPDATTSGPAQAGSNTSTQGSGVETGVPRNPSDTAQTPQPTAPDLSAPPRSKIAVS